MTFDLDIEPETEPVDAPAHAEPVVMDLEPEPEPQQTAAVVSVGLVEILPADFPLPLLTRFVPNAQLRADAEKATAYALSLTIDKEGADGLQRADLALGALRESVKAIGDHLAEPIDIANRLHKTLTGVRSDWTAEAEAAIKTVGRRVWSEQRRLEDIAAEARRAAQEEANRKARELAEKEASQAAAANAPTPVVEELRKQAQTAQAAPVPMTAAAPAMKTTTTVTTWKARLAGTPADAEPNPKVSELSIPQQAQFRALLKAILDDKAPITAVDLDWGVLNGRAKADKSTLVIPGIEAFPDGGVRAKGTRSR